MQRIDEEDGDDEHETLVASASDAKDQASQVTDYVGSICPVDAAALLRTAATFGALAAVAVVSVVMAQVGTCSGSPSTLCGKQDDLAQRLASQSAQLRSIDDSLQAQALGPACNATQLNALSTSAGALQAAVGACGGASSTICTALTDIQTHQSEQNARLLAMQAFLQQMQLQLTNLEATCGQQPQQ
jgi:hypothetical protein